MAAPALWQLFSLQLRHLSDVRLGQSTGAVGPQGEPMHAQCLLSSHQLNGSHLSCIPPPCLRLGNDPAVASPCDPGSGLAPRRTET